MGARAIKLSLLLFLPFKREAGYVHKMLKVAVVGPSGARWYVVEEAASLPLTQLCVGDRSRTVTKLSGA